MNKFAELDLGEIMSLADSQILFEKSNELRVPTRMACRTDFDSGRSTPLQRATETKQYTILLLFITLKMLKSDPEAPAPRQGRRIIRTRSSRATVVLIFF